MNHAEQAKQATNNRVSARTKEAGDRDVGDAINNATHFHTKAQVWDATGEVHTARDRAVWEAMMQDIAAHIHQL